MGRLLTSYGDIKNEAKVINELKEKVKGFKNLSGLEVTNKINAGVQKTDKVRYFDFNYIELEENESGKEVMWLDTGYTDKENKTVYVQFTGGNSWSGAFVGTEECILNYQKEYRANNASSKERMDKLSADLGVDVSSIEGVNLILDDSKETKSQQNNKNDEMEVFLDILYSKLLISNGWDTKGLDTYVNMCIARINNCIAKNKDVSKYVVFNSDKSMAIINSGLLDTFGKSIILITRTYKQDNAESLELGYTSVKVSGGKANLTGKGFSKADLNRSIERVSFSDNGLSDLVFTDEISDFDLESRNRLEHCITERRFRFPEKYSEVSAEVIYSDIVKAIEIAVEINKCDRNYIKPLYNRNTDCINFVIPYHVTNDFQKKPELGIVIAMVADYWQIMTVLNIEEVMRDIKIFNMYENETF